MKVVVCGPASAVKEAGLADNSHCMVVDSVGLFGQHKNADVYINLNEDALSFEYDSSKPVFVNSVLEALPPNSEHLYRVNGWPGFLQRDVWEIAGKKDQRIVEILSGLGKKHLWVKDEPGFISARVISMIVNEAFFAIEDKVSSREEIDTAMKLGTGYPYGPFEWAALIGRERIAKLLQLLALSDERYQPSVLLISDISQP